MNTKKQLAVAASDIDHDGKNDIVNIIPTGPVPGVGFLSARPAGIPLAGGKSASSPASCKAVSKGDAGRFDGLAKRAVTGDKLTPTTCQKRLQATQVEQRGGALVMSQEEHVLTRDIWF